MKQSILRRKLGLPVVIRHCCSGHLDVVAPEEEEQRVEG